MPAKKGNTLSRMSEKEYDAKLKNKCKQTGYRIRRIGPFTRFSAKTKHLCLICNNHWEPRPNNLLNAGSGCPNCGPKYKGKPFEQVKAQVEKARPTIKVLARISKANNSRFLFQCRTCAHEWSAITQNVLRGANCPSCANCLRYTRERFIARAEEKFGKFLDYSKVPKEISAGTKVELRCPKHGGFSVLASEHLNNLKFPCARCAKETQVENQTFTREEFIVRSKAIFGNLFGYKSLVYTGLHSYLTLTCKIHGDFQILGYNHLHRGSGCGRCNAVESSPQKKIREAVESKGITCLTNTRKIVKGHEIDVYLPEYKLGIEVNGVYWHCDENKTKDYHYNKTLACKKEGITLLHVWDYEVRNKLPIILSMIRARVGKNKRVYARKCEVVSLDTKEARAFLDVTHIQGADRSSIYLGLKHKDDLVMVMSFSKPRFDSEGDWELVRLSSKRGLTVVGGASRMLSAFRKQHVGSIVSYANLRYSQGGVYRELGFAYAHKTSPNYAWIKGSLRYSRYQTQKHKLGSILANFNECESESENMRRHGFLRVFDCGNLVYKLV